MSFGRFPEKAKKIFISPYFIVKSAENKEKNNRFGIIVSAKAEKKAARRHFIKRQISEKLKNWPNLQKDFIFMISPRVAQLTKKQIHTEFQKISAIPNELPL